MISQPCLKVTSNDQARWLEFFFYFQGKISLTGNIENRLEQLDKRETELLEENKKQSETIKRLKIYRKRYEEKE